MNTNTSARAKQPQPNQLNSTLSLSRQLREGVDPREITLPGYEQNDRVEVSEEAKESPSPTRPKKSDWMESLGELFKF